MSQVVTLAVNTIVKNKEGEVSSCDILYTENLDEFNRQYLEHTAQVAATCQDKDLSDDCMVIGTSAIKNDRGRNLYKKVRFRPLS